MHKSELTYSGDFNTGGDVGFGVTWGSIKGAIEIIRIIIVTMH